MMRPLVIFFHWLTDGQSFNPTKMQFDLLVSNFESFISDIMKNLVTQLVADGQTLL